MCAATVMATDESMRVSSSIAIAYETVSPPAPPYSSRDRQPHEAELRQLRDELVGKASLEVELRRDRGDALARERADGVADELLLGSEVEVHAAQDASHECGPSCCALGSARTERDEGRSS